MKRDDTLTFAEGDSLLERTRRICVRQKAENRAFFTLRFRETAEEREIREKSFLFDKNGLQ